MKKEKNQIFTDGAEPRPEEEKEEAKRACRNERAAMQKRRETAKIALQKIVLAALFTALAFGVCAALHFKVYFLTLDFKDAILAIGGMFLGPVYALAMSAGAALLELTISTTEFWGLLMNFFSSAAFSVAAAIIYKYRKSFSGALLALGGSVISVTSVMLVANLLITPIYAHTSTGAVAAMIPKLLLPFNLIKSLLNASLVALLYKPLSAGLSRIFPEAHPHAGGKLGWRSVVLAVGAVLLFVAAMIALYTILQAQIEFGVRAGK